MCDLEKRIRVLEKNIRVLKKIEAKKWLSLARVLIGGIR